MSNLPWLKQHPNGMTLELRVKPASRQNALCIDAAGLLAVSLQAVPEDGQANKMLIKYLAKLLKLQQKQLIIQRGATSRNKLISITATPDEQQGIIASILKYLSKV